MRLWIMEHFRMLPTDPKFKELTDEQIEILYLNYLKSPEDSDMKAFYRERKNREREREDLRKNLEASGKYSKERIEQILDEVGSL